MPVDDSSMSQTDPFPPEEFDAWAETYDQDVLDEEFPFTGYAQVLDTVVEQAGAKAGMTVLDLGAGTGNLAARFIDLGCELWLTDFSPAMLNQARSQLTGARFFLADLRKPWPDGLDRRFDCIVSAYVFHHFELDEKIRLVQMLVQERLHAGGVLVIADLSFPDQAALEAMRAVVGEQWDDEPYWIVNETLQAFRSAGQPVEYTQVSSCAGVYRIAKVDGL
jgi:putative AdoMet-dependent methyltransferase